MNNYPCGVTDNDPHFDLPSVHEDETGIYGLVLDTYDGQAMSMVVYDGDKPVALTLEEIQSAQQEYTSRNPKGRYSIFPIEQLAEKA